jgi:hypothetical protein
MVDGPKKSTLMEKRFPKDELTFKKKYAFIFRNWKFTKLREDLEKKQIDQKVEDLNQKD